MPCEFCPDNGDESKCVFWADHEAERREKARQSADPESLDPIDAYEYPHRRLVAWWTVTVCVVLIVLTVSLAALTNWLNPAH